VESAKAAIKTVATRDARFMGLANAAASFVYGSVKVVSVVSLHYRLALSSKSIKIKQKTSRIFRGKYVV
jgi:hypothetical protein